MEPERPEPVERCHGTVPLHRLNAPVLHVRPPCVAVHLPYDARMTVDQPDEPAVFGPVASDATVSRLIDALAAAGPKACGNGRRKD